MNNYKSGIISESKENQDLILRKDKCDKIDYLVAVGCGALGGIIDIFFVGAPGQSALCNWTDKQVDKAVITFAKANGWNPKPGKENNIKSAIGFLEGRQLKNGQQGFRVNYDQAKGADVEHIFEMSTRNHHMKSLSHSPDIVGLFFSVINQFTATSTFISGGQLITVSTDTFELYGNDFASKIFCAIVNWLGHLMSDIAGSYGASGRGSGIVIPFYELLGLCRIGEFGQYKQDLGTVATMAFEQGYDFRFGMAMAIPVVVTDLSIKFLWALRRYFQYGYSIKECIPSSKYDDLRMMLLVGNGVLCAMDGIDAFIRSGGNILVFFTRMNIMAWFRFVMLIIKEICIRIGLSCSLDSEIEALKRVNEALKVYLAEIKRIDIELFKKETDLLNQLVKSIRNASDETELNQILLEQVEALGISLPWDGDFDEFMMNKEKRLVFE